MATDAQVPAVPESVRVRVERLSRRYWRSSAAWGRRSPVQAVDDVSFEIPPGKTFALVGRSGSGKSTVARCVMRLETPDAGKIWIGDTDIAQLNSAALAPFRSRIQMVFQDPITAMNPRMSAAEIIEEPLLIQRCGNREERRNRVAQLLDAVHVPSAWMDRRAAEFSGGQQQRLAIARALALGPKLLVLDEALSGLDLSTQAQIANLLLELQADLSLTYLLISHDLELVARMADEIAVMAAGKIAEHGTAEQVVSDPQHQETRSLLGAARDIRASSSAARGASA